MDIIIRSAGDPAIIGLVCSGSVVWTSITIQQKGERKGALLITVPCLLVLLTTLTNAYASPEKRTYSLVGSAVATLGAGFSFLPYVMEDEKEEENNFIISMSCIGASLGLLAAAFVGDVRLEMENPVIAPAVMLGVVENGIVINNPLHR